MIDVGICIYTNHLDPAYFQRMLNGLRQAVLRREPDVAFRGVRFVFQNNTPVADLFLHNKVNDHNWLRVDEVILSDYPYAIVNTPQNARKVKALGIPYFYLK